MTLNMTRRTQLGLMVAAFLPAGQAVAQVVGTPARFQMTLATTASRQGVYALWANPSTWANWDPQIERVTITGPVRVGAKGKLKGASGPENNIEIIAMEPGVRFAYAASGPGLRIVFERRFEAGTPTRFTHSVTMTGAAAGFLAGRLGRRFQEGMPIAMGRLKALAERAA
jgi:uncharacterized protein YndB with AHSA1/START domain